MMNDPFLCYQKQLLFAANTSFGRKILNLDASFSQKRIVSLLSSSVIYQQNNRFFTGHFYAKNVFSKKLKTILTLAAYTSALPFLHYFDLAKLAFSLPYMPLLTYAIDGGGGGRIVANVGTWQNTHDQAVGGSTGTTGQIQSDNTATPRIIRFFTPFDTSSIGANAQVSIGNSQNFIRYVASGSGVTNSSSDTVDIVVSTQASNTALATSDYPNIGTTIFASKAISSWVDTNGSNNDFTLNINGDNQISKTGYSKFAARMETDRANSAPAGGTAANVQFTTANTLLSVTFQNPGAAIFFMQ